MFQLRFYALVVWRMTGTLPRLLQLTYLGSGEVLRFQPDPEDLEAFEGKLRALWASMVAVMQSEGWTPRPGPLCRWCPSPRCARRKAARPSCCPRTPERVARRARSGSVYSCPSQQREPRT